MLSAVWGTSFALLSLSALPKQEFTLVVLLDSWVKVSAVQCRDWDPEAEKFKFLSNL